MKGDGETTTVSSTLSDQQAAELISVSNVISAGSVIASIGQAGGQIAHSITNVLLVPTSPTEIVPVIKRQWNFGEPLLSTLQFRLRNAGSRQPQSMKLRVVFPAKYIRHNVQSGQLSSNDQFSRYFERQNDFFVDQRIFEQLYPGEVTRLIVQEIHYFTQDPVISEGDSVDITLRSDDAPEFHANVPLTTIERLDTSKWYELSRTGEIVGTTL
jgi:hypothetical protein